MTIHRLEARSYSETSQLAVHSTTSVIVPYEQARKMTAKQRLDRILGKEAIVHTIISNKDSTPIAYYAQRNGQLIELHIYPANLSVFRQAAEAKDDYEFNWGFCNWASYEKSILALLSQIANLLMKTQSRVLDFENHEGGTELVWCEQDLRRTTKQVPEINTLREKLHHTVMDLRTAFCPWVYSVTQYVSTYTHSEILGPLFAKLEAT